MSMPRKVNGTCSKCNTAFDLTVWDTVNTDLSPDIAQRIISGEFFKYKCPHCGFVCHAEYISLYHDMKRSWMIWVIGENEDFEQKLAEVKSVDLFPGYTTRVVRSTNELREKVSALEAGRDDKVIEIIKRFYRIQLCNEHPEFDFSTTFYFYVDGQETIEAYDTNGKPLIALLEDGVYKNFYNLVQDTIKDDFQDGYVFDLEWGKNAFGEMINRLNAKAEAEGLNVEQYIAMRNLERENEELRQKRQAEFAQKQAQPVQEEPQIKSSVNAKVCFCRKCGTKLMGDSVFCHKCGEKVIVPSADSNPTTQPTQQQKVPPLTYTATPSPKKEKRPKRRPKWIAPLLVVLLAVAAPLYMNMDYLKSAFVYEVSITGLSEFDMVVGATRNLSCTTNPKDLSADLVWESSDTSVVKVSGKGVVTAKDEGTATITVSLNGIEKDSCTVHVSLKPVSVKNGQMIIVPKNTGYPEVTINAPKGVDCFVYFENVNNSANDFAFYVTAGSSATVNAPAGTYNFYYATGDTWYGKELKFGKDTNFYKSPDKMILTEDSTGYDVIELTLYAVPNGNMDTDPIDENEFPI